MGIRGIDISEHQRTMDVERVVRENGIDFAFIRTNYGANHDDAWFHSHADAAERGGAIVVPYVYILASNIRGSIDDCVRIINGRYSSAIVDWEHDSGGGRELRDAHELLWERGFSTPVVYDPKWYWESVGSPDLSWMQGKVSGHWKSWYADNTPRSFDDALSRVPGYVWDDNRGGIPTVIVQFSGTGRLSGYGSNVDLNFYPGTREELAALLGGDSMSEQSVFKAFSAMAAGETDEARQAAEDLRQVLVHYKFVKAPDTEVRVVNEETGETNESTPHDENRWQTANFDRLADLIKANAGGGGEPVEGGEISDENAAKVAQFVVAELKKEGN